MGGNLNALAEGDCRVGSWRARFARHLGQAGTVQQVRLREKLRCNLSYRFATFMLWTPEKIETAAPVDCGSHHMRRTKLLWLSCMRRPA